MSSRPSIVYWDSCLFIDLLKKTEGRLEYLEPIWKEAEKEKIRIATSTITRVEVYHIRQGSELPDSLREELDRQFRLIDKLFDYPFIEPLGATSLVTRKAVEFRPRAMLTDRTLSCPDSIHLASAVIHEIPKFLSSDGNFLEVARFLDEGDTSIMSPDEYPQSLVDGPVLFSDSDH